MSAVVVKVYSKTGCKYCVLAKEFLNEKNIPFEEVLFDPETSDYRDNVDVLIAKTGHRTFPQIFFGEEFIGGYSDMMTAFDTLRLHDICKELDIELDVDF
jgi:glutaredoxin 3